jgi:hypothetical protein
MLPIDHASRRLRAPARHQKHKQHWTELLEERQDYLEELAKERRDLSQNEIQNDIEKFFLQRQEHD